MAKNKKTKPRTLKKRKLDLSEIKLTPKQIRDLAYLRMMEEFERKYPSDCMIGYVA